MNTYSVVMFMKNADIIENKGIPKRDGSGAGRSLNRGRGGCKPIQNKNARNFGFGRGRGRGQCFGRGFIQQDEKALLEQQLEIIKKRLKELG